MPALVLPISAMMLLAVDKGGCLAQVIDIPNSMTVLPELLPYSIEMVSLPDMLGVLA